MTKLKEKRIKMASKCIRLDYNWRQCSSNYSDEGFLVESFQVGFEGVKDIKNMTPEGEGIGCNEFYEVEFENGDCTYVYNPNQSFYRKIQEGCDYLGACARKETSFCHNSEKCSDFKKKEL